MPATVRIAFLTAVLALIIAACGGSEDAAPEEPAEDSAEASAEEESEEPEEAEELEDEAFDLTGETLEIVVQYSPGGGFDLQAREMARIISDDYDIDTVVINDTGAGGLVALNNHAAEDPDSLRILYIQTPAALYSQIGEAEGVRYDLATFPFLARAVADELIVVARADAGYESFDDVLAASDPSFVATGPGGIDYLAGSVIDSIFDEVDMSLVTGYEGSGDTIAGLLRGDGDLTAFNIAALQSLIEDGDVVPIVVVGTQRVDAVPDVPLLSEVAPPGDAQQEAAIEGLAGLAESGRTIAAVPGTSEPIVEALRELISEVVQRDDFTTFLEDLGSTPGYVSGEEVGETLTEIVQQEGTLAEVLRAATN